MKRLLRSAAGWLVPLAMLLLAIWFWKATLALAAWITVLLVVLWHPRMTAWIEQMTLNCERSSKGR